MTPRCAACGAVRPLDELLAYWPRPAPGDIGLVCRPGMPHAGRGDESCFRASVGSAAEWAIGPAEVVTPAVRPADGPGRPPSAVQLHRPAAPEISARAPSWRAPGGDPPVSAGRWAYTGREGGWQRGRRRLLRERAEADVLRRTLEAEA